MKITKIYTLSFWLPLIPGLLLSGLITLIAIWLSTQSLMINLGLSALTLAIIIGILLGNTIIHSLPKPCHAGIQFSKQRLLRLGIILYGFRLTFQQITAVGAPAIVIDLLTLASTFLLACWAGKKIFALDTQTTILIGSGASICGAAAVMATEPIVKADSSKVSIAIATVVVFGTIAMFIYPWIYQLNQQYQWLEISQQVFGIYIGSTIHEVAQVVVAGEAINYQTADAAVITKMIRVMMLAPFLILLSWFLNKKTQQQKTKTSLNIPWFAVLFIVVAAFNSLHLLPESWVKQLIIIDTILLTMAMGALGLTTHVSAIKQAGLKPILLAVLLFAWLIIGGGVINMVVQQLLS